MYQTMGDNSGNKQNKGIEAATTEQPNYTQIKEQVISHLAIQCINPERLLIIPQKTHIRAKTLFNCLLCVWTMNRASKSMIYGIAGYNRPSVNVAIDHLVGIGLIREVGKPRLIKPFQKFKVDRGYLITETGERAIIKILS